MTDGSVILKADASPETLAIFSQQGGPLVPFDPPQPTLTNAERDALDWALCVAEQRVREIDESQYPVGADEMESLAETIRGLLGRLVPTSTREGRDE